MTLIVGSVSSAAAAVVVHEVWRAGSIIGGAATPVLMALFAEALRRPAERLPARWRLAMGTGLAAFVLGAAGLTAAEALLERSVARADPAADADAEPDRVTDTVTDGPGPVADACARGLMIDVTTMTSSCYDAAALDCAPWPAAPVSFASARRSI